MRGRRQRGQVAVIAAVAMVAIVGAVAIVVDQGIFLIVQRQFEWAADAGALAGAWHAPVCQDPGPVLVCLPDKPGPMPVSKSPLPCDPYDDTIQDPCAPCPPGYAACDIALANANTVAQLCVDQPHVTISWGTKLFRPKAANTIVVVVQCRAGYSFGRILNLTTKQIKFGSAAAIGGLTPTGDIGDFPDPGSCGTPPPQCLIARLID